MSKIFIGIVFLIAVLLFGFAGQAYVRATRKSVKAAHAVVNRQKFVKQNRAKFGVENRGTSMDGCKIFTVSPSDIGL